MEYEPISLHEYQKRYEEQKTKYIKKKAAKFGFQLIQDRVREGWINKRRPQMRTLGLHLIVNEILLGLPVMRLTLLYLDVPLLWKSSILFNFIVAY